MAPLDRQFPVIPYALQGKGARTVIAPALFPSPARREPVLSGAKEVGGEVRDRA